MDLVDTDALPLRQLPNGNWQLRKRLKNGRRVEVSLRTKKREVAEDRARQLIGERVELERTSTWRMHVERGLKARGWLYIMNRRCRMRAKTKKGGHPTLEVLRTVAERAAGHCEVSGIPFYVGDERHHPFQPSIDRIDSARGYEVENMRMVCLAVNYCMGKWGEKTLQVIAATMAMKQLRDIVTVNAYSAESGWGGVKMKPPQTPESCI